MSIYTLIIGNKNYSSWSLRAWLAMKQAGMEFAEIRIPLDLPETRSQILRYSPTGRVPALRCDALTIWDSLAICEYIAEQFPDALLLPQDTQTRAIVRSVSAEMHSGFPALRQRLPMDCRARYPYEGFNAEVQSDIDRVTKLWQTCRQQYGSGNSFLFGHFTLADAMFAPVASRFVTYNVPVDAISQAYIDALYALPALQEWLTAAAAEAEYLAHP
jgi:glutathione S-transferase